MACFTQKWTLGKKENDVSIRLETEFPYMENLECPYTDGFFDLEIFCSSR